MTPCLLNSYLLLLELSYCLSVRHGDTCDMGKLLVLSGLSDCHWTAHTHSRGWLGLEMVTTGTQLQSGLPLANEDISQDARALCVRLSFLCRL